MHDKCTCGKFYNKASCHFRPPGTSICPHPPHPPSSDPPLLLFHYELALLHSLLKKHNVIRRGNHMCINWMLACRCGYMQFKNQKKQECTHQTTVSTENTSPPKSTKSRNSDSSLCRGTNWNWNLVPIWICTEEFEFLDLANFGSVACSVESVICAILSLQHTTTPSSTLQHTLQHPQVHCNTHYRKL